MKRNLTELYIKTVAPPARGQAEIFDQSVTGLSLRVGAKAKASAFHPGP
jgi:hypothetical protein